MIPGRATGRSSPRRWHSWSNIAPLRRVVREWIGERVAGLAVAAFEHSARAGPQLSHPPPGRQRRVGVRTARPVALDSRHLYRWKMAFGRAVPRNGRAMGFPSRSIRDSPVSRFAARLGCGRTFQAVGPDSNWLAAHGGGGREGGEAATLSTRSNKPEIDRPVLARPLANRTGTRRGWGPEQAAQRLARSAGKGPGRSVPALADMREGLVAQQSTFTEREAWRAMAEGMQGGGGIRDIEARLKDFGVIPPWSNSETTDAAKPLPIGVDAAVGSDRHCERPAGSMPNASHTVSATVLESILRPTHDPTPSRPRRFRYLCERGGAVATVGVYPGTGKSFLLDTARAAWAAAGYRVGRRGLVRQSGAGVARERRYPKRHAARARRTGAATGGALDAKRWWWWTRPAWWTVETGGAGRDHPPPAPSWCWWAIIANSTHRGRWPCSAPLTERIETPHLNEIRRQAEPWAREAVDAIAEGRVGEAALDEKRGFVQVGASSRHRARPGRALGQGGRTHPTACG